MTEKLDQDQLKEPVKIKESSQELKQIKELSENPKLLTNFNLSEFQMFSKMPETQVMSEPWILLNLHRMYNHGKFSWKQYLGLLETCTKLSFKPAVQRKVQR